MEMAMFYYVECINKELDGGEHVPGPFSTFHVLLTQLICVLWQTSCFIWVHGAIYWTGSSLLRHIES